MAQVKYDTTEAQNVMREIFLSRIYKHYEQKSVLWSLWEEAGSEYVHDRGLEWAVDLEPNPSMAFIGSGGLFPRGSSGRKKKMKVTYATFAMTRRIVGQVLYTDRNSIIKGLRPLVMEDSETFTKALNVLAYGNGDARLATVAAAPAGTGAVTMKGPIGSTLLWKRGKYNIVDPADGTKRTMTIGGVAKDSFFLVANSKATDVAGFADDEEDAAADNITATTVQEDDIVVFDGSYGIGVHGMNYHLNDTGTYQNLARATYPDQLVPAIKDALNGPLTVGLMDWLETQVIFRKGTQEALNTLFWLCNYTMVYGYRKLGYNTDTKVVKQFAGTDVKLDLGWKVIEHNGRQMLPDVDCPPGDMYLTDRASFKRLSAKEPGLVELNGQYLHLVPGFDSSGVGAHLWQYNYYLTALQDAANVDILNNGRLKNLNTDDLPTRRF